MWKQKLQEKKYLRQAANQMPCFLQTALGQMASDPRLTFWFPRKSIFLEKSKYFIWKMNYIHEQRNSDV